MPFATVYPLDITLSSPLVTFAPLASNGNAGWAPSCTSSSCVSTASWSTNATNSTLEYTFSGLGVVLQGSVQGSLNVKLTVDGKESDAWNPSNGTLFTLTDLLFNVPHSISLTVHNASADARLTIDRAHVSGSTLTTDDFEMTQWTVPSNDGVLSYAGFSQQASTSGSPSPTTYVSTTAGDKISATFNSSALLIYGPCGPSNGLLRVTIDGSATVTNTSRPYQADDCLLFQSGGLSGTTLNNVVIENVDGREIAINRFELKRVLYYAQRKSGIATGAVVVGTVVGVIVLIAALIIAYSMRSRKTRQKINRMFTSFCS